MKKHDFRKMLDLQKEVARRAVKARLAIAGAIIVGAIAGYFLNGGLASPVLALVAGVGAWRYFD